MKNKSECKCGKGSGCCRNTARQTGEHLFSNPSNGIPRCITCGCDEDDAFVGGEECSFNSNLGKVITANNYKGYAIYICQGKDGYYVSISDENGKYVDCTPERNDIESVKSAAENLIDGLSKKKA